MTEKHPLWTMMIVGRISTAVMMNDSRKRHSHADLWRIMMTRTLDDGHKDENEDTSIDENVNDGIVTEEITKSNENDDVENGGYNPGEARQAQFLRIETRARRQFSRMPKRFTPEQQ
eukprot:jgi/Phyca11/21888/fgenesh1_pg.PHYCAscaffold_188_\